MGLLLGVVVHPADVQDRDGAEAVLRLARRLFPLVERIIGDAGHQGPRMAAAVARAGCWTIEILGSITPLPGWAVTATTYGLRPLPMVVAPSYRRKCWADHRGVAQERSLCASGW